MDFGISNFLLAYLKAKGECERQRTVLGCCFHGARVRYLRRRATAHAQVLTRDIATLAKAQEISKAERMACRTSLHSPPLLAMQAEVVGSSVSVVQPGGAQIQNSIGRSGRASLSADI